MQMKRKRDGDAEPVMKDRNLQLFWSYIAKRHNVYKSKEIEKQPKPWSNDLILNMYKFTNVFRFLDPGTKYLIDKIGAKYSQDFDNYVFNCVYYRLYNKIPTLEHAGLLTLEEFDKAALLASLKDLRDNKHAIVFTNAFTVSSFGYMDQSIPKDKVTRSVECIAAVHKLLTSNNREMLREMENRQDSDFTYNSILKFWGIGPFLAYQIAVDVGYKFPNVYNESTHVVAGPGCKRGLNNLFLDPKNLNEHQQMQWLVDDQQRGFKAAGIDVDELFSDQDVNHKRLNLMAIENCLCEISKYLKAYDGTGRPRNRYMGASTKEQQDEFAKQFREKHPYKVKRKPKGSSILSQGPPKKKMKRSPKERAGNKAQIHKRAPKMQAQALQPRARSGNRPVSRKRRK